MMELPHRQYFEGEERDAFLHGVEIALTKKRMKKIALIRLCIKLDKWGKEVIHSLWGRPERAAMMIFNHPVAGKSQEHWLTAGKMVGIAMENWVDNDLEFERANAKALGLQFDVWETSEYWDRTQDMLDVLEHDFSLHINGKFHWRVRKALTELIEMMLCDVNTDVAGALAEPNNLDALRAVAKKAGYDLVAAAAPVKKAVAREVA